MRLAAIVILLFGIVLLSACLQKLSSGHSGFEQIYRDSLKPVPIGSPADLSECQEGSCWCVACSNNTPIFPGRQNLIGGSCYVEKECKPERLADLNDKTKNPSIFPLQFMVGQGPTFGDFGTANTYCADRLSMSVQWLVGSQNEPYLLPDAKRAMCFLSKGVMPVFVLYSNGSNVNASRAYDIARILGTEGGKYYNGLMTKDHVGPVVVITEMNFDKSQASLVAEQVRQIDRGCGNDRANNKIYCFIAVAPKMNDFAALDAVMDQLSLDSRMVDLVAYGVDSRFTSSCDGNRAVLEALNFSSYALYNHTKPSIIPYVMFDNGSKSASGCVWSENQVVDAYGSFFPLNIQSLQKRGVIGVAAYTFNSTSATGLTNPLNCSSCSAAGSEARLKAWYGGCQKFASYNRLGNNDVADTTQILFGNTSGTVCNHNTQLSYMGGFSFQGRDILQPALATNVVKANLSYSCDMCLTDNLSKPLTEYFTGLKMSRAMQWYKEEYCTAYPEINQWASARNMDPMLIRAVIATESGFKPCEVAKVCAAGYNPAPSGTPDGVKCFDNKPGADECYSIAFDEMYVPENTPGLGTSDCPILVNDIVPANQQPKWRWCAFGLMQSLEPPISFWPAQYRQDGQNGQYVDVFLRAGIKDSLDMASAKACDPVDFNPFTASDSICVGTAKMESRYRDAKNWIQNPANKATLNWDINKEEDKTNLFAAYIAVNKYSGLWDMKGTARISTSEWPVHPRCTTDIPNGDCWAIGFKDSWLAKAASPGQPEVLLDAAYCSSSEGQANSQKCKNGLPRNEPPGYCYGYTDFIEFVEKCEVPFLPVESDRGRVKMEAYIGLVTNCKDSTCPDGKQYFTLAEKNLATVGNPYMPSNLVNPP